MAGDGSLAWEYQLRSDASTAQDAALVGQELFVLATLHGEQPEQVLLRFEP